MPKSKKILIAVVSLILAVAFIWAVYWFAHFYSFNEYRKEVSSYEYEEGKDFQPLQESKSDVEGMALAAENDTLKLYANIQSGEVAVVDKRNGQITYSNPANADDDAVASGTNKSFLKSQLIVDFFNTTRTQGTMDSYSYCTSIGQLETEAIENGVRLLYTLGDMTSKTGIVPQYINSESLDLVLANLSEEDASFVSKKYRNSSVADNYKELLESAVNGASQIRKLNKFFEEAGFTQEDYNREMMNSGVEGVMPISFVIPLEYRLQEDAVEVSIPMSGVKENGGGAIFRIQMLRYFGAAGMEEDGYMLVPNGSGSLINFNNGKTKVEVYSQYVYGIDPLAAEYTVRENTENIKMALFGICRNDSSIFATIEDGASLAYLTAGVSGKINQYNYVYPTFVVRGNDKLSMFGTTGNEADIPIVEKEFYDTNLSVRYTLLTEEDKGYNGAANYYRNRLIQEGVLTRKQEQDMDIKFYYDVLGNVEMAKYILAFQYEGNYAMTTFEQAQEMSNQLRDSGISNQVMNFQGWMNGGYNHDVVDKIKIPMSLGGKSGIEELSQTVTENGGTFYADVAFQKVSEISKRYSFSDESSRYYGGGYIADFGLVNPTTLRQTSGLGYEENIYARISPKFLVRYVDKFTSKIQKYDIAGIALRDMGNELHSDKKRTNVISREAALDVVSASLAKMQETGKNIMLHDANDYAFSYADDIINAPLTDNDFYIIDETVPFYQMLIHGCIDYAGSSINLSDSFDRTDIVLNLIETGASPHFIFSYQNANKMKNTGLNRFYATTFVSWKDEAVAIYQEVNEVLKKVNHAEMIEYNIMSPDVKAVTYSNGITIYTNSSTKDQTVNGVSVPARGYRIGGTEG